MKKSRFTDSQIMDAQKRAEAGKKCRIFAGNLASVLPCFTAGGPNTVEWIYR
jgi:hypothetical protein